MTTISKGEFIERCGDPLRLMFKGQCYDAGESCPTPCGSCGGVIRFCYVLKLLEGDYTSAAKEKRRVVIGECCFPLLKSWNPRLYGQLLAAKLNLRTVVEAAERDRRVYGTGTPK